MFTGETKTVEFTEAELFLIHELMDALAPGFREGVLTDLLRTVGENWCDENGQPARLEEMNEVAEAIFYKTDG